MKKLAGTAFMLAMSCLAQNLTEVLEQGEQVFAKSCATGYCHGVKGGPGGAPRLVGRHFDQAYISNVVTRGVPNTGMPSFAAYGMADDSWKLVLFIRHLPQLTAEERLEISRYNPKSPEELEEEKNEDEFLNGATPQKSGTPKSHP